MSEQTTSNSSQKYTPPSLDRKDGNANASTERPNYDEILTENFESLNLKDSLLRGIYALGFEKPSVIQQKAILPVLDGHDVIAQAQSGTGKTATFSIGMLNKIDESVNETQGLILAHTRELALQIHTVLGRLSNFMTVNYNLCVGGSLIKDNIDELLKKPHIVIGTPGRVLDMITFTISSIIHHFIIIKFFNRARRI